METVHGGAPSGLAEPFLNCTYDADTFPFTFFKPNGTIIYDGVASAVPGFNGSICLFNITECLNAGLSDCCVPAPPVERAFNHLPYFVSAAFFIPLFARCFCRAKRQREAGGDAAPAGEQPIVVLRPSSSAPESAGAAAPTNSQMGRFGLGICFGIVVIGAIVAVVMEATIMPMSIQQSLRPPDRAAQLAMNSFLVPVSEMFAFIEDAMTVRVGYALATHRFGELNLLLHVSVLGGLVCGALAFGAMVALSMTGAAAVILNPSAESNARLIADGCGIVPSTEEILAHARVYWLLSSACWLPAFAMKGVMGLIAGSGNLMVYLLPSVLVSLTPLFVWFGGLPFTGYEPGKPSPLTLLGVAYGSADWLNALLCGAIFLRQTKLREDYQLRWLLGGCWPRCLRSKRASEAAGGEGAGAGEVAGAGARAGAGTAEAGLWVTAKEVAREGAELMCVDVAVQLSLTVTIYIAASRSFETAYKLAAAQAAYWQMGPQYLVSTMYIVRIFGSQMVASGQHAAFVEQYRLGLLIASGMAAGAVLIAALMREPLGYEFGASACVYASEPACAPAYARIFGTAGGRSDDDKDDLSDVFTAFGPTVGLQMLFQLLRAGLAVCHDFTFMARAAVGSVLCVYVPTIIVARLYFDTAVAYYISMYAPHFALILVFGARMVRHAKCLSTGRPGPWTAHMARASMSSAARGSEPAAAEAGGMRAPLVGFAG